MDSQATLRPGLEPLKSKSTCFSWFAGCLKDQKMISFWLCVGSVENCGFRKWTHRSSLGQIQFKQDVFRSVMFAMFVISIYFLFLFTSKTFLSHQWLLYHFENDNWDLWQSLKMTYWTIKFLVHSAPKVSICQCPPKWAYDQVEGGNVQFDLAIVPIHAIPRHLEKSSCKGHFCHF